MVPTRVYGDVRNIALTIITTPHTRVARGSSGSAWAGSGIWCSSMWILKSVGKVRKNFLVWKLSHRNRLPWGCMVSIPGEDQNLAHYGPEQSAAAVLALSRKMGWRIPRAPHQPQWLSSLALAMKCEEVPLYDEASKPQTPGSREALSCCLLYCLLLPALISLRAGLGHCPRGCWARLTIGLIQHGCSYVLKGYWARLQIRSKSDCGGEVI